MDHVPREAGGRCAIPSPSQVDGAGRARANHECLTSSQRRCTVADKRTHLRTVAAGEKRTDPRSRARHAHAQIAAGRRGRAGIPRNHSRVPLGCAALPATPWPVPSVRGPMAASTVWGQGEHEPHHQAVAGAGATGGGRALPGGRLSEGGRGGRPAAVVVRRGGAARSGCAAGRRPAGSDDGRHPSARHGGAAGRVGVCVLRRRSVGVRGFFARLDQGRNLVWVVSLGESNPFERAVVRGSSATFTNNLGNSLTIDLTDPHFV